MDGPAQKFLAFLKTRHIENVSVAEDIAALVADNYESLTPPTMRALVDCALEERDANAAAGGKENELLGSWGVVIDTFKEQTIVRRERAGAYLQQMVVFGFQSPDGSALQAFIDSLREKKHVDSVLMDLVGSSLEDVDKHPGNDSIKNVLGDIYQRLKPSTVVSSKSKTIDSSVVHIEISEDDLVAAGNLLRGIIQRNSGDAGKLKDEVAGRMRGTFSISDEREVSLTGPAFQKVLNDNISACSKVGYANKTKFLEFLKKTIDTTDANTAVGGQKVTESGNSSDHINHAPQFVDENRQNVQVSLVSEDDSYIDVAKASEAIRISATGSSSTGTINKKKKNLKASNRKKVGSTAESVGAHLEEHGWAVCDHAIPDDIVKRVRVEAGLFTNFYENAEIWVGKKSDIGAQLSVPSVRGDRVLWMCGGHKAVEGVTRNVKTSGDVEPCRLEVKAQAPIRKFAAIKDLVATIDCLVYEMKKKCSTLSGLFERSDAMLAVYPGEGARFARHIDNTTCDGRRLTVLAYLNPEWSPEQGGALRLFSKKNQAADGDEEDVANELNAIDVFPQGGRVAMFYSADIQHEVRPTFGERHSITLWYYDKEERQAAVESSKESGESQAVAESSLKAQRAAKDFISELMGGDEVNEDGGLPTVEELQALSEKLVGLDDETVNIISSITGAPSTASFREGFPMLSVEDLKQMRGLFRRMGLNDYDVD